VLKNRLGNSYAYDDPVSIPGFSQGAAAEEEPELKKLDSKKRV
jgi:hypothetical protein